jgi:lipopolysaccharide/colanic/teichoic acid biosynthesis glycosyltransferase
VTALERGHIENVSIFRDLRILLLTFSVIVTRRSAY